MIKVDVQRDLIEGASVPGCHLKVRTLLKGHNFQNLLEDIIYPLAISIVISILLLL